MYTWDASPYNFLFWLWGTFQLYKLRIRTFIQISWTITSSEAHCANKDVQSKAEEIFTYTEVLDIAQTPLIYRLLLTLALRQCNLQMIENPRKLYQEYYSASLFYRNNGVLILFYCWGDITWRQSSLLFIPAKFSPQPIFCSPYEFLFWEAVVSYQNEKG